MRALRPVTEDPSSAGIFLDVDGTLAPIVERAEDARVPDETKRALEALVPRYACVACVSGRAALDARRLVGVEGITYAGSHGAELLFPGEDEPEVAPAFAEWAPRVREFVESQDTGKLRVEHKGAIVALHWRGVEEEEVRAREIADRADGFVTHWGRKVLEIRPPVEVNKGQVVKELIARYGLRAALFAGDDATDLDAFDALPDGVRVGVRSDEGPPEIVERADLVVDDMADVLAALRVRFGDFLRTSVLLFGAAATACAIVALAGARAKGDDSVLYLALGWWLAAALLGLWFGRRREATEGIAKLLADARTTPLLPELEPGTVLFNRLWSFGIVTVIAGALAFLFPQVPAIWTGFTLLVGLAWRKQPSAVLAIEERDGVRFYVERVSPFKPTRLLRTPGFRKNEPAPTDVQRTSA